MNLFLHLFQFLIKFKQNVEMPEKEIVYHHLQSYSSELRPFPISYFRASRGQEHPYSKNESVHSAKKSKQVAGLIYKTVAYKKRLKDGKFQTFCTILINGKSLSQFLKLIRQYSIDLYKTDEAFLYDNRLELNFYWYDSHRMTHIV